MVLLPIFSYIMLKVGHKSTCLLIAATLLSLSYLNLLRLPSSNNSGPHFYISIGGIALFYSLYSAAIWPSLALSMPREVVSVGYGIASLAQMIPMSCFPSIVGKLSEGRTAKSYERVLWFVLILAILGLLISIVVMIIDRKNSKVLLLPENSREVQKAREKINETFLRGAEKKNKATDSHPTTNEGKTIYSLDINSEGTLPD